MRRTKAQFDELAEKIKALPEDRKALLMDLIDKKVYSVREAAELMGVSEETIRRAIRSKRLKAFRIGGDKRAPFHITGEELNRFMGGSSSD